MPSKTFGGAISHLLIIGLSVFLGNSNGFAQTLTNSSMTRPVAFVRTNGEFVIIGGIKVKTNSPLNTEEFKSYMWRVIQLDELENSGSSNAMEQVVDGAWTLVRDYPNRPDRPNGYQTLMGAIDDYQYLGDLDKAGALAAQLATNDVPETCKRWAKGVLSRLNAIDRPFVMKFTAVDGREVDVSQMKGKVVLVDFWATDCGPCVAELPKVKVAYDEFHARGFEVVGISCDTDKAKLVRFVKEKGLPWPQYFDGKDQEENNFAQGFGIDGIPHMFLLDKHGLLRFDNVRADDKFHPKGDNISFEDKILKLLAEP